MAEFLPLCDLLFNVVSLAAYFCDLIFDFLVIYALYGYGMTTIFLQCLLIITLTMLVSQILSLRWYFNKESSSSSPSGYCNRIFVILLHCLQMGVLWRYACLLVPVQLSSVKQDVRDLCILRLIHGFLQAAPMLLLQLSLLTNTTFQPQSNIPPSDLITVSACLSLFSVCWSLASFSKHVQCVDRLILTWLGVASQLIWRIGTVTSRAIALSAYTAMYHSWIFLVLGLHWACMFLWLLSPRSPFHGQRGRKLGVCAMIAAIYILAYINLQQQPHSRTMTLFYVIMLLENSLLVSAWIYATWNVRFQYWEWVPISTVLCFFIGIVFMLLYYRFFHVSRLIVVEKQATMLSSIPPTGGGVFNCRFAGYAAPNAALYRKKKKPTTFVPPPSSATTSNGGLNVASLAPMAVPFWRRPLPSSSENEGSSVGSRINIHQKLQEKKQKQLAELKIIEEEIKQGKLVGPENTDFDDRQPIPHTKKHVEPQLLSLASLNNLASYGVNLNRRPPPRAPRNRTPELLLTPRYLYCDCANGTNGGVMISNTQIMPTEESRDSGGVAGGSNGTAGGAVASGAGMSLQSDLESLMSLPRSYTLPTEFKYYRRQRIARPIHTVASTNSSDGDVDSADDESDTNHHSPPPVLMISRQLRQPHQQQYRHETKL